MSRESMFMGWVCRGVSWGWVCPGDGYVRTYVREVSGVGMSEEVGMSKWCPGVGISKVGYVQGWDVQRSGCVRGYV